MTPKPSPRMLLTNGHTTGKSSIENLKFSSLPPDQGNLANKDVLRLLKG